MYKKSHSKPEQPLVIINEKGQKVSNPNQITMKQHVIAQKHLAEWAAADGRLTVREKDSEAFLRPTPYDAFRVERLWDQPMEGGTIKSTEDNYQSVLDEFCLTGNVTRHRLITEYFVMLAARAFCAAKPRPEGGSVMDPGIPTPSKAELEAEELEYVNESVRIISGFGVEQHLSRFVVSQALSSFYSSYVTLFENLEWVCLPAQGDEFILPDSFLGFVNQHCLMMPARPDLIFIETSIYEQLADSGRLNTEALNGMLMETVRQHYVEPPAK